jgi:hypothetical protein
MTFELAGYFFNNFIWFSTDPTRAVLIAHEGLFFSPKEGT